MTFLQVPGLRSFVSCFIAFFVVLYSASLYFDGVHVAQLVMPLEYQGSINGGEEQCNWSEGSWVYDNVTRPLYSGPRCAFLHDEIACDKYGRNDTMYQHWRWQPHGCNLPRFNATKLLEKIRGKRMIFVGDSLNRNQWVSIVCLLESAVPEGLKTRSFNGSLWSFKAKNYDVEIDFYWEPLILESNSDDPIIHRVDYRIIRSDSMGTHAKNWVDYDIIVFNSYLWWKKPGMKMKITYGSFEDNDASMEEIEMTDGFKIAMRSWSKYLETYINTHKTKIFFVSLSPTHFWGREWGAADDQNCLGETEPIYKEGYFAGTTDYGMMRYVEAMVDELEHKGVHVQILNVTQLSEYRKDGHPSIFRRQFSPLSEAQLANPRSYADCTHWCLPGVPDVWNEILYAHLVYK